MGCFGVGVGPGDHPGPWRGATGPHSPWGGPAWGSQGPAEATQTSQGLGGTKWPVWSLRRERSGPQGPAEVTGAGWSPCPPLCPWPGPRTASRAAKGPSPGAARRLRGDHDESGTGSRAGLLVLSSGSLRAGGCHAAGGTGQRAVGVPEVPRWDEGHEQGGAGDSGPALPVTAPSRVSPRPAGSRR